MTLKTLDIPTLDIETAPTGDAPQEYALQPWRVREGTSHITNIGVGKASGEAFVVKKSTQFRALLRSLEGQTLLGYNLTFDLSFLIASGYVEEIKKINWIDAMIVWKWADNSQRKERRPAWSLADCVKRYYGKETWALAFIKMKEQEVHAGENDKYWETRAKLDCIMTSRCAIAAYSKLTDQQKKSCMITMASLIPAAESYERGVMVDFSLIDDIAPVVTKEMAEIEYRLGVHNNRSNTAPLELGDKNWTPSKILRSPKQLAELLYEKWGLTAVSFSKITEKPSTDKAALTYLADDDDHVIEILRWRQLNTRLTKYLQSPLKARNYLNSDVLHPQARIFSTYTGRMTYSSKMQNKHQVGMALHQWPRQKEFRALIRPRPGYKHVEFDASGQESRLMADVSGDLVMKAIFNDGMDFHSYTGAQIAGIHYDDFMKGKAEGNTAIVGDHGYRYQGKFTNLSNNYRIGVKKLRVQARVQYGMNVDFFAAKNWQDTFHRGFQMVNVYWKSAINKSKMTNMAETMAGRTYKLDFWDKDSKWSTESSAINFPIQGSGADMKDLAIQEINKHFPEFEFWFDLHDGLHYEVKEAVPNSRLIECRDMLDNMDYTYWWDYTPSIPLTWDVQVGKRWSELKEL